MSSCPHCAGTGDFFDHKLDDWAPNNEKCARCEGWGELGRAVDGGGRFCGLIEETKRFASMPEHCGYCGANCEHCSDFRVYALQNGIWVCAAAYDEKIY